MMAVRGSLVVRHSTNQPKTTLSYLATEDSENDDSLKYDSTTDVPQRLHEGGKTEKSVHFATEYESVSEAESTPDSLKTSRDVYTLLPSEHLYSGDTFMSETRTAAATDSTDPSYDTNTFVALESEDETRTASDISNSESFASSTVFSQGNDDDGSSSTSGTTHREWKDVTDIVKDIDELEESEFVTRRESLYSDEAEATDITDSSDEEMAAIQRDHFLLSTVRRLKLRDVLSPRSLTTDLHSLTHSETEQVPKRNVSREEADFCQRMIMNCRGPKEGTRPDKAERGRAKPKPPFLEHYGLSSAIVDRLKVDNLRSRLAKKAADIDSSTEESLQFIEAKQAQQAEMQKQKFISHMLGEVQRENMDECIQAHLIRTHPVKCFAEFVQGLPRFDENSREILYKYKCKLEAEMNDT